jgi:sugar/nucleoside kinase (ribokinase family)
MKDSGLIMDELVKVDGCETSQAVLMNDSEMKQMVIFFQGPQGSATKLNNILTKNASVSEYVHFCTGEPDYYISVMEAMGSAAKIAIDPAQEVYKMWDKERILKALDLSDALFCNDYEAKVIERYLDIKNVLNIEKELVVRTDGANGSTAKIDGEIVKIPAVKGKAFKDATGAGDAYRAGFYSGRYNKYGVYESLILAAATASFVVEEVGALTNTPTWEDVRERAEGYL